MLHLWGTVVLVTIGLACSRAERPPSDAVALYQLVTVGGRPLSTQCSDGELRASRYELSGSAWIAVDTVFKNCTDSLRPEYTRVRRDSGVFILRGDTITFENPAANLKLGEARVVLMGLFRKDTLIAWGSDEDGGDHVFVRQTP
ncbi:MAG TPA: hypothetical protein VNO75_09915 [Gemmatimonadaceae bacterium]|nr:hypothetical protein [Gemmatimonadaceae bacterium]